MNGITLRLHMHVVITTRATNFWRNVMPISMSTAISMTIPDQAVNDVKRRSKKMRIINGSLYLRLNRGDPVYCWDVENDRYVYLNKSDWLKGAYAISTREACAVMNIKHWWFLAKRNELGIKPKYDYFGKPPYDRTKAPLRAYYTVDDLIEIARVLVKSSATGENDLRKMFADHNVMYIKTSDGQFVPIWDASI